MTPTLHLKSGRDKSARHRHPWLFSGALGPLSTAESATEPASGETVRVLDCNGQFLGWAAYSPSSQIRLRFWSHTEAETIDPAFFQRRIARAVRARAPLAAVSNAARLVHGESDGLPGLVVDQYNNVLVVQFLSAGAERWRAAILAALQTETQAAAIFERSDADVRELEGLPTRVGLLAGALPDSVEIIENGLRYRVDVVAGQKTGFYLDQRRNRHRIGSLAAGLDVLNCFCYSGGFTLAALQGGAKSTLSLDSSADALQAARVNAALNGLDEIRAEWLEADVFQHLRQLRDRGRQFDLIILDPPKFAPTAQHVEKAARAYKDINLWAIKLLRPGGWLATFSCSGGLNADLFQKIVAGAAWDTHADLQIIERLSADTDHPVGLGFPEGDYLKGLLLKKLA